VLEPRYCSGHCTLTISKRVNLTLHTSTLSRVRSVCSEGNGFSLGLCVVGVLGHGYTQLSDVSSKGLGYERGLRGVRYRVGGFKAHCSY